jgi:hypothetical protein
LTSPTLSGDPDQLDQLAEPARPAALGGSLEVNIAGAPIAAAHAAAAELEVPASLAADEQQFCPNRVPTASWSLLLSLLFRGAVKRPDTPRNG